MLYKSIFKFSLFCAVLSAGQTFASEENKDSKDNKAGNETKAKAETPDLDKILGHKDLSIRDDSNFLRNLYIVAIGEAPTIFAQSKVHRTNKGPSGENILDYNIYDSKGVWLQMRDEE